MRNRCVRHPTQISVIFYHFYDPDFPIHCGGHHHHDQHRCLDRKIIATLGMEENRTKKNSERKNYTLTHTVGLGVSDSQASRSVERGHQIVPYESLKWPTNAGKTKQTARAACARHSLIEFIVHTNFGNWTIFFLWMVRSLRRATKSSDLGRRFLENWCVVFCLALGWALQLGYPRKNQCVERF